MNPFFFSVLSDTGESIYMQPEKGSSMATEMEDGGDNLGQKVVIFFF